MRRFDRLSARLNRVNYEAVGERRDRLPCARAPWRAAGDLRRLRRVAAVGRRAATAYSAAKAALRLLESLRNRV